MDTSPSTQPVSWFRSAAQQNELELAPDFQRKPIWNTRQRSALIETLLLGYPVPEIFIQEKVEPDGSTVHVVVDGQQRVRTLLKFLGIDSDPEDLSFGIILDDELSPWHEKTFADFTDEERQQFFSCTLVYRRIPGTVTDATVRDIFARFNKNLSPVNRQELRNARFTGPFIRLADELADDPFWVASTLVSPAAVRRMKDVEFVSDLLIGMMYGPQAGNAATLDRYYEQLEGFSTDGAIPDQGEFRRAFTETQALVSRFLPVLVGRWKNRTDFYSLFVAAAEVRRDRQLAPERAEALGARLESFSRQVNERLKDEHVAATRTVVQYVRAVEKGASDKSRRAVRHGILVEMLLAFFE